MEITVMYQAMFISTFVITYIYRKIFPKHSVIESIQNSNEMSSMAHMMDNLSCIYFIRLLQKEGENNKENNMSHQS